MGITYRLPEAQTELVDFESTVGHSNNMTNCSLYIPKYKNFISLSVLSISINNL